MHVIGDITRTITYRQWTIKARIYRVAYPRNGNTHNPTTYKRWDVYMPGCRQPVDSLRTLRMAKQVIDRRTGV